MSSMSRCIARTHRASAQGSAGRNRNAHASPASRAIASATWSERRLPRAHASMRPKASGSDRSFAVMTSTSRADICSHFVGTTPCQPKRPHGESFRRQSSRPM